MAIVEGIAAGTPTPLSAGGIPVEATADRKLKVQASEVGIAAESSNAILMAILNELVILNDAMIRDRSLESDRTGTVYEELYETRR